MRRLPPRLRLFLLLALASALPLFALPLFGLATGAVLWLLPVVLAGAYAAAQALARPFESLLAMAGRLRAGELDARALPTGDPDLALLGQVLAELAERLEAVTRHMEEQVAQRTAALNRKADQLRAVGQIGQQVAGVLEPDALFHFVVRVLRGSFGHDVVAILQRQGEHLVLAACAARGVEEVPLGRVFAAGGALPLVATLPARSELAVPLRLAGRDLGTLVVQSERAGAFDADDRFVLETIAGQVAVALENARLFAAEKQLRDLAITAERQRLSREIHDTLAQGFMGILMHLRAMQGAATPAAAELHREQAEALARESLQEARRSVWNLRPRPLEGKGLAGALADEVENLARGAPSGSPRAEGSGVRPAAEVGPRAQLQVEGDPDRVPAAAEAALLRIAQEALHNVRKYARAGQVTVRLAVQDEWVELQVSDDGGGFDPAQVAVGAHAGGFGLAGMAERARLLGGELRVEAAVGRGCRVTARIPLPPATH